MSSFNYQHRSLIWLCPTTFLSWPLKHSGYCVSTLIIHSKWKVGLDIEQGVYYANRDVHIEIEITRKASDGKISKVFFDPTGRHLIITTDHGENFYLYEKWRRTKQLSKLKVSMIS